MPPALIFKTIYGILYILARILLRLFFQRTDVRLISVLSLDHQRSVIPYMYLANDTLRQNRFTKHYPSYT